MLREKSRNTNDAVDVRKIQCLTDLSPVARKRAEGRIEKVFIIHEVYAETKKRGQKSLSNQLLIRVPKVNINPKECRRGSAGADSKTSSEECLTQHQFCFRGLRFDLFPDSRSNLEKSKLVLGIA